MALGPNAGGGPAFPTTPNGETVPGVRGGMTLRDWFAGQAITGIMASYAQPSSYWPTDYGVVAHSAYAIADAMLAARVEAP